MRLTRLQLSRVRNLEDLDIRFCPSLNIIEGANASGKSSLLEAIHILSCGKSFRTRQLVHVLRDDAPGMTISAEVATPEHGMVPIGIEYERGRSRIRLRAQGRPVHRLSELASLLPLVMLHQESHRVFTEGPQHRRQLLDRGLFHVEPLFLPAWQRYRRVLKQRNSTLQGAGDRPQAWDPDLAESAGLIDSQRRRYLDCLQPLFIELADLLEIRDSITAHYQPGWDIGLTYADALRQALRGDLAAGFTRFGPHRAEIEFLIDGIPLHERLSRGQLKVLVYALNLAQALSLTALTGRQSLLMLDDLTAELDERHTRCLLDKIGEFDLQVFITGSGTQFSRYLEGRDYKMFHVEHGRLVEVL
jgi:DNA replication and repair protein RecF